MSAYISKRALNYQWGNSMMRFVSLFLPLRNPEGSFNLIKPSVYQQVFLFDVLTLKERRHGNRNSVSIFGLFFPVGAHKMKGIKI